MNIMAIQDDTRQLLHKFIRPGSAEDSDEKRLLIEKAVQLAPESVLRVFLEANRRLIDLVGERRVRTRAVLRTGKDGIGLRYDTGRGARPTEIQTILLSTNPKWAKHIVAYLRGHDQAPFAIAEGMGEIQDTGQRIAKLPVFLLAVKPSDDLIDQLVEALQGSSLWID